MADRPRTVQQFMPADQLRRRRINQVIVPLMLGIGALYLGAQALTRDWVELVFFGAGVALLLALAISKPLQTRLLGRPFNHHHALYIAFYWTYSILWLAALRLLIDAPWTGKDSGNTYFLLILLIALSYMMLRSLATLTRWLHTTFITQIPLWEQVLVAANELIAAGVLAAFGANTLTRLLQPEVFTTRFDPVYTLAIGAVIGLYYFGIQLMWVGRWNNWLSRNEVWVRLARIFAPLALIVTSMVIFRHFSERPDPRAASLLGDADLDLTIMALGPVILLVVGVLVILVYTGGRGLRQRFLPDDLLERLPNRAARLLNSISDMDMLLIIGVMATLIPAYLFLSGDSSGLIGALREQILQRGSALIETSEQALALVFALPFYLLAVALLVLYAFAIGAPALSASERDSLVSQLPIGFLITLIITLYLFAIPFSQVLVEGRLPRLPQDLGRVLAFNIVIPLVLLYAHYFLLIRLPYGRGQAAWRGGEAVRLQRQLEQVDRRIDSLNRELEQIDRQWNEHRLGAEQSDPRLSVETLYRYVQFNGQRDDLNMQRLQIVAARQQLTELSEAPVALAVARLPVRIVSIGIPLLIAFQIYQWAVLNNGLREIINDPNLTVFEFFRAILEQAQF
jgi:hypothetical protein